MSRTTTSRSHTSVYVRLVVSWVLAVVAMGVALYPSAQMWINDKTLAQGYKGYHHTVNNLLDSSPGEVYQDTQRAYEYNKKLNSQWRSGDSWSLPDPWGGATDDSAVRRGSPEIGNVPDDERNSTTQSPGDSQSNDKSSQWQSGAPDSVDSPRGSQRIQQYNSQMNTTDVMGYVVVPRVGIQLPIYKNTDEQALFKGAGHVYGTSLPVGGQGTHTALAGHSGVTNVSLFDRLPDMVSGDVFYIDTPGKLLKYQVGDIQTVTPDQVDTLKPQQGEDLATLITCVPYGWNTHRLLVTGHRVPLETRQAAGDVDIPVVTPVSTSDSVTSGRPTQTPQKTYSRNTTVLDDFVSNRKHEDTYRDEVTHTVSSQRFTPWIVTGCAVLLGIMIMGTIITIAKTRTS